MLRITFEGEKTEYLEAYKNFGAQNIETLNAMTHGDSKGDIILLTENDKRIDVYPQAADSLKELSANKKKITVYEISRDKSTIKAFKLNANLSMFQASWNINFGKTNESILIFEESSAPNGIRQEAIKFSGKEFKRYDGLHHLIAAITLVHGKDLLNLYLINSDTGAILSIQPIFTIIPAKIPLINVYDNAVVIALHYSPEQKLKDKVILVELYLTSEIAETTQSDTHAKEVKEEELIFPIKTIFELDWEFYGLKMIRTENNKEYIATIDENKDLRLTDIESLQRGSSEKHTSAQTTLIDIPNDVLFRAPISMTYCQKTKRIVVHGLDIYSVIFP